MMLCHHYSVPKFSPVGPVAVQAFQPRMLSRYICKIHKLPTKWEKIQKLYVIKKAEQKSETDVEMTTIEPGNKYRIIHYFHGQLSHILIL